MRLTLNQLMHSDLIAIRTGLAHLETSGIRFLDCDTVGLSSNESVSRLRQTAEEWKQPFQKEYTERTVSQAFDKLLSLRSVVERALEKHAAKQAASPIPSPLPLPPVVAPTPGRSAQKESSRAAVNTEMTTGLDFETCMEQIWEQLIAAPPTRGRSMTTIRLGAARALHASLTA